MPQDDFFKGRALAKAKADRLARGTKAIPPPAGAAPPAASPAKAPATPPTTAPPAPPAAPPPAPAPKPLHPEASGRMADVSEKPHVAREAVAEGFLRLKAETLRALADGTAPKGDPFPVARVAGILAAKKTPDLVPLCHPIPLTMVEVECLREERGVRVRARVKTTAPTGVEMEALAAVSAALLTVWDMTKALEKDATGNYPDTAIEAIRVLSKTKGSSP